MGRTVREGAYIDVARSAARLFLKKGVAGTSGEEIAEAAGISKRTLWRYFRSKESCVEPLFALTSKRFAEKLDNWPLDMSVEQFLELAYEVTKLDAQEIEDSKLVVHLIAVLEEEPTLLEPFFRATRATEKLLGDVIATRLGKSPTDFEVRLCAATVAAAMRVIDETISAAAVKHGQVPTVSETHKKLAQAIRRASTLPFCDPVAPHRQ